MNPLAKLGAFTVGLAAVFTAAAGIGAAAGPLDRFTAAEDGSGHGMEDSMDAVAHEPGGDHLPGGLQIAERGYRFDVATQLTAGRGTPLDFRILGPDGARVTAYDTSHN